MQTMPPSLPLQHVYGALATQIDRNELHAMKSVETFSVEYGICCYKEQLPLREQDLDKNVTEFVSERKRIIQKLGFDAKFSEFKIQSIVGSCNVAVSLANIYRMSSRD
ncbi:hypothetical protein NEOLEDRAFT_1184267 [Neolentinus lepideus HHB14362 ss-1]|uniref:Uncharacterized protein n=1 Tax=Neolentinus lepideus HHB14362 ss-1 TaxID=1314782 RepID=A0A165ML73_9AGAM|nr:hypothetical protein NEOLEDRAFT_1184267 [Neolentinus lepideus HHB14362 ss-1]